MASLFLQEGDAPRVQVHPVVVFTVLDSYMRRRANGTRAVGTLLGSRTGNLVEVTDCYTVPFKEEDDIVFDEVYDKNMLGLKRQLNDSEEVVGWFGTAVEGENVDFVSCKIHDYYGGEYGPGMVHLVVDPKCTGNSVSVTGYLGSVLALDNEVLASKFDQIRCDVTPAAAEKIAVDMMVKTTVQGTQAVQNSNEYLDDLDSLETSIRRLLEMLDATATYVDDVVAGKAQSNELIGRQIAQALAAVPRIEPDAFGRIFNDSLQDMLMIVYLSNLTRTQLAIADKIAQCDNLVGLSM